MMLPSYEETTSHAFFGSAEELSEPCEVAGRRYLGSLGLNELRQSHIQVFTDGNKAQKQVSKRQLT